MAVPVEILYDKSFESPLGLQETYDRFAAVEKAVPACFPGVERFEKRGPDTYHWVFEKVGYSGHEVQFRLVTRFVFHAPERIEVLPVPEPGTSRFTGGWKFTAKGTKTDVRFRAKFDVELPLPFFLKSVAVPLAQKELTKLFDRYVDRAQKSLA